MPSQPLQLSQGVLEEGKSGDRDRWKDGQGDSNITPALLHLQVRVDSGSSGGSGSTYSCEVSDLYMN